MNKSLRILFLFVALAGLLCGRVLLQNEHKIAVCFSDKEAKKQAAQQHSEQKTFISPSVSDAIVSATAMVAHNLPFFIYELSNNKRGEVFALPLLKPLFENKALVVLFSRISPVKAP